MKVTILGTEYECRHLSDADRLRWNLYLFDQCWKTFYSDLHNHIEHLPGALQDVIFRKHSPPARLDQTMPLYYTLVTTSTAVRMLLALIFDEWHEERCVDLRSQVTPDNATEIFLAVKHLIEPPKPPVVTDTPEKQKAAEEVFAVLEGEPDAHK